MVPRNYIYALLAVLTFFLVIPLGQVQVPYSSNARLPGDPIKSSWFNLMEDGCFADGEVVYTTNNAIFVRKNGYQAPMADWANSEVIDHSVLVRMQAEPGSATFLAYNDLGKTLIPEVVAQNGVLKSYLSGLLLESWTLRHCSQPTFWGAIQTLWRPTYVESSNFTSVPYRRKTD